MFQTCLRSLSSTMDVEEMRIVDSVQNFCKYRRSNDSGEDAVAQSQIIPLCCA
jgi:hypothetical protein